MSKIVLEAYSRICCVICLFCLSITAKSQLNQTPAKVNQAPDTAAALTLDQCVTYALKHEPNINMAIVNIAIVRATNAINTSGWLPQVGISGNFTHYNTLPTGFFSDSGKLVNSKTGIVNTVTPTLQVTQTIFNPALLYAVHSAPLYIKQAEQITDSTKIDIVAAVSKSYYSLLNTLEQINIFKEDTARLAKNVSDTYQQFVSGVSDKTNYDEAVISLNNSLFSLRQAIENVRPQYAVLKQVMGYPPTSQFDVLYDTAEMKTHIDFDTTQQLQFERRIEYQYLQTTKALQQTTVDYYRKAWLPTLSAFFNYEYEFENNKFSQLFNQAYPFSYEGLTLSWPIFTGFARVNNIKKARLQYDLLDWQEVALKSQIWNDYTTAMANYKSNIYNLNVSRENVGLAKETYDIVDLQYLQGVVPYLNVITAETNLIQSELTYETSIFQVLSSKVDLQKAMGIITVTPQ
ncbi:MAG TPA: TolC family protein [Puia sp.]|jgi:outer membrane protein TolC|nr:TolC family protein [Puia sp.]